MSNVQFWYVGELIQLNRYEEARAVLQSMEHPDVDQWLRRVEELEKAFLAGELLKPAQRLLLQRWLRTERLVRLLLGALAAATVLALWTLAPPGAEGEAAPGLWLRLAYSALIGAAGLWLALWPRGQQALLRLLLRMQPASQRQRALLLALLAAASLLAAGEGGPGLQVSSALFWAMLALHAWWRALHAGRLAAAGQPSLAGQS